MYSYLSRQPLNQVELSLCRRSRASLVLNHRRHVVGCSFAVTKNRFLSTKSAALWYEKRLNSHPIIVKAISSGIIAGAGDLISQGIIERKKWDPLRTFRFFALGVTLVGPVLHYWFGFLAVQFPSLSASTLIRRVAVDQFFFSPIFVTTWVSSLWTLEGRGVTMDTLGSTIPNILVANWMLWIPVQWVIFSNVPVKFQVLASNFVALVWNSYLSYSTSNTKSPEKRQIENM